MERTVTTMPRGGARTPGAGKALGRPRLHPEGAPRPRATKSTTISLYPDELEKLTEICEGLGIDRSEFVRRAMANAWLFKLSDTQLDALRKLTEGGRG